MARQMVFAELRPATVRTKIAFDDVYRKALGEEHVSGYVQRMLLHDEKQNFHQDVYQERKEEIIRDYLYPDLTGEPPIDEITWIKKSTDEHLGLIWAGTYTFDLETPPARPEFGWVYGAGEDADFVAVTEPYEDGIKEMHATFDFNQNTGFLSVVARGPVMVNGISLRRGTHHALNQPRMHLHFGDLDYTFVYTDLARCAEFYIRREEYINSFCGQHIVHDFSLTPTPSGEPRTIGQWTIGRSLGKGKFGKVYAATNSKNCIVAVKIVERSKRSAQQLQTLQQLQRLSAISGEMRLLRMREVIHQGGERNAESFEDIAIILEPVVRNTLLAFKTEAFHRTWPSGTQTPIMHSDVRQVFRDVLRGVQFLHSNNYYHGDLKPSNIGVNGTTAILLDLEDCTSLRLGHTIERPAGTSGTINYLAPEREMGPHDHAVDVWSLGVILCDIAVGQNPFSSKVNPWRPGAIYEAHRAQFEIQYQRVVKQCKDFAKDSIFLLALDMIRYAGATAQQGLKRITAEAALAHECWEGLT